MDLKNLQVVVDKWIKKHGIRYFDELTNIVENNDIGVIKMEVMRNFGPNNNFLKNVRDLATRKGIVLIFDECTSGFRETFGGQASMETFAGGVRSASSAERSAEQMACQRGRGRSCTRVRSGCCSLTQ